MTSYANNDFISRILQQWGLEKYATVFRSTYKNAISIDLTSNKSSIIFMILPKGNRPLCNHYLLTSIYRQKKKWSTNKKRIYRIFFFPDIHVTNKTRLLKVTPDVIDKIILDVEDQLSFWKKWVPFLQTVNIFFIYH